MSMNEWDTYTGRLLWAMRQAGKTNQSGLARAVGIRPQSIQYLCDPQAGARGSSHTPSLARELGVDAEWLATGEGQPTLSSVVQTKEASPGYGPHGAASSVMQAGIAVRDAFRLLGDDQTEATFFADPDGELCPPLDWRQSRAVRVKGNALVPFAKDGQFLLLQQAMDKLLPQDHVVLTLHDGRVLIRELIAERTDSVLVLPVHGGQPEAIDRRDIDTLELIMCVAPQRWWRPVNAQQASG